MKRWSILIRPVYIVAYITNPESALIILNHLHSTDTLENPGAFTVLVKKYLRFWCWKFTDFTASSALLSYIWKKKGGMEVIILWNKWKLWSSHISYRLIRASVTYSKPQCFTRESICAPRPSKLFSVLTVCSVNMTDMLIRVLFVVGHGNHLSIHHIYNVI